MAENAEFPVTRIHGGASLYDRTEAKPPIGTVRHTTLTQDVVIPNKDAMSHHPPALPAMGLLDGRQAREDAVYRAGMVRVRGFSSDGRSLEKYLAAEGGRQPPVPRHSLHSNHEMRKRGDAKGRGGQPYRTASLGDFPPPKVTEGCGQPPPRHV